MQSDLLGLFGGSLSTYSYAKQNPLSFVDPLGLSACGPGYTEVPAPGNEKNFPQVALCQPDPGSNPSEKQCVTAECVAGLAPVLEPTPPSCELKCSLVVGSICKPIAAKTPGNLYVKVGSYAACEVAVELACRKACEKKQCSTEKK